MKYSAAALVALAHSAAAYPQIAEIVGRNGGASPVMASDPIGFKRQGGPEPNTGFNPKLQHVSIEGDHAFVAPDLATDARGPCPGLNAMANHGYLPHNGIGTHLDFIQGTYDVFGMGPDLAGFLTVLGATIDGNGLEWSIGGPNAAVPVLPGLGTPQGISGSHNKYESDVSPCRGDLYKFGNDFKLEMSQCKQLIEMGRDNADDVTLDVMNEFRSKRFDNSIATNPYFFNGPFTGVLVAPAAFEFIYRFMGNKSAEHPQGKLTTEVMMSFMSITEESDGSFVWTPGHEKIPYNWYKRAVGDEYTIQLLNDDTVLAATRYPKFLSIGGNLGKVNTFTGVDPQNLTGGALSTQDLLQGNNLACFAMEFAAQAAPDMVKCSDAFADVESILGKLNTQLEKSTNGLDCPALSIDSNTQFSKFPGYSKLNCKTGKY